MEMKIISGKYQFQIRNRKDLSLKRFENNSGIKDVHRLGKQIVQ